MTVFPYLKKPCLEVGLFSMVNFLGKICYNE